jgi:F0F1-type ATP synthase membrane subunit b/b'
MGKIEIREEVNNVVDKISDTVKDQFNNAKKLKDELGQTVHKKQVAQKKLNAKIGKQVQNGIDDIRHDVDRTVKKITKTIDREKNKK